jgi:hypothetical protein
MVFVDRSDVTPPAWFGSPAWAEMQRALVNHLQDEAAVRSQRRIASFFEAWPSVVVDAVWKLFSGRCAICQSALLKVDPARVRQFRPAAIEEETLENRHAHAYAALLWDNLILLRPDCDRARGDRFPLQAAASHGPELLPEITQQLDSRAGTPKSRAASVYRFLERKLAEAREYEVPHQIDPTFDQPAHYLRFDQDGQVHVVDRLPPQRKRRGQATIEIFHLNRMKLVDGRCKSIALLKKKASGLNRQPSATADARMAASVIDSLNAPDLVGSNGEFEAAKLHCFVHWLLPWLEIGLDRVLPRLHWSLPLRERAEDLLLPIWDATAPPELRTFVKPKAAARKPKAKKPVKRPGNSPAKTPGPTPLTATAPAPVQHYSRERVIKVRLRNFRHFRDAVFELRVDRPTDAFGPDPELAQLVRQAGLQDGQGERPKEPDIYGGWKMLLGENGVGKSSILQAIALALLVDQSGLPAVKALCNLGRSLMKGASRGSIEVWFEDRPKPIRLGFTIKNITLTGQKSKKVAAPDDPATVLFLRGYGAARLLPPRTSVAVASPSVREPQEVQNLFNPYASLADPEAWLLALKGDAQHLAFITLKDLLDLPASDRLGFETSDGTRSFGLFRGGHFIPLEHFSAGYQSVVTLACDIMAGFGHSPGDMQKRTGVVLLDEIGMNLHPRWRLRIVQALRRAFPLLQFVASTHEPLCLRGLGEREVSLITAVPFDPAAPELQVDLRDDLPSPALYRVDQLLTGDFFGLETAYDPNEEAAFDAYHHLLVRERELSSKGKVLPSVQAALLQRLP